MQLFLYIIENDSPTAIILTDINLTHLVHSRRKMAALRGACRRLRNTKLSSSTVTYTRHVCPDDSCCYTEKRSSSSLAVNPKCKTSN